MMVKEMVTPRTAAGSAWPERPILAIVGYRVVYRPSRKFEMSSQSAHARTMWLSRFRSQQRPGGIRVRFVGWEHSRTGCESHCLEALQVPDELFGACSVVSPRVEEFP
jgi:hypothetical protein